jgi:Spy/CpxP family protein refolding chaperone
LAGFQAVAQRGQGYGRGPGNGEGPRHLNRLDEYLNLSDEQKNDVEKLQLDFQKATLSMRNKIREKNAQLNTMVTEGADKKEIDKVIDEIGDLRTGIHKSMIDTHLKIRDLLNDEQKVKFDNHFLTRPGMQGHMGGFGWQGRGWN